MSVIQRTAFDSSKIKQKIKQTPLYQNKSKGPMKASYEIPTQNWQVKYRAYNSPKIVENGSRFRKEKEPPTFQALEESSEYGTMENYDQALPQINLNDLDSSFNDVSIGERRERISSILDEILSIPRLAEANITQRSLSRSSMARFTGGGSVRASRASQISNRDRVSQISNRDRTSQISNRDRVQPSSRQSRMTSRDNKSSKMRQERVLLRSASSPKLTQIPEKKSKPRSLSRSEPRCDVPRLQLDLSRESDQQGRGVRRGRREEELSAGGRRREEELSAEFLPTHDTRGLRPVLSDQTQSELVLSVPTMEDETGDMAEDDTFDMERSTDFVKANMKVVSKARSGRSSAVSSVSSARHKAGSVPRYLRSRQAQWAEEAAAALAAVPDPDCPPGHVRLPEVERQEAVETMTAQHASLLQDLNRLPVSSDSRRVVCRRKEIENNLNQLEEDIRKFSRLKVFIPLEDHLKENDNL